MGHGKQSPRDKMIGMMYLVLTALLALNVSAEVLNAFAMIDSSLEKSAMNTKEKNDGIYTEFAKAFQETPDKVKPWKDKADKVKVETEKMIARMEELKLLIVTTADGPEGDPRKIQNKADNNIPGQIMILEGKGLELKKEIKTYEETLLSLLKKQDADGGTALGIKASLSTADVEGREGMVAWEQANFNHLPLAGVVALMTKIQADFRNSEATILSYLYSKIDAGSWKFNKVEAIVKAPTSYVLKGQSYKAEVFIAASDSTQEPQIFVGGRPLPIVNGKGIYTGGTGSVGPKSWSGKIKLVNPATKDTVDYPFKGEFTVGEAGIAVSPTKMNVFYMGVPNPVDITVSGVPADKVRASISNGKLTKGAKGYTVRVKGGKETFISVSATMDDGSTRNMGRKKFRVKKVPDPKAKIRIGKELFDGSKRVKKNKLANARVVATMENFDFDLTFKVVEFTLSATIKGYAEDITARSGKLTSKQISLLKKINPGQKVYFEQIKARGPDGTTRNLGSIGFKVQ